MASVKDANTCTSYYVKKYKQKYKSEPDINRFAARWVFDSVLGGMDVASAKELIDYYFTTPPTKRHSFEWFQWNYEKLITAMRETADDKSRTQRLMEESKLRAERWRQSGKQGIADNQRSSTE